MRIPRRQRRIAGRHALVDGIPFVMPIDSRQSPAFFAVFTIDARRAATLLPGGEVHPLRVSPSRALLAITVVDYRVTDIGPYIEFSVAIPCTHGPRPAVPIAPGLLMRAFGSGQFVLDLPVSTEVSVKGGKGIWGMPKHQADLDFTITPTQVASRYELDGQLVMHVEIDRPDRFSFPVNVAAANYCTYRGMLMKSFISFAGRMHAAVGRRAVARLVLGEHPRADAWRGLDISSQALFTAFIPDSRGVLDDHYESWFLTYPEPVEQRPEGLETVVDLGRSEEWLASPGDAG